jgi:hypothetical protein
MINYDILWEDGVTISKQFTYQVWKCMSPCDLLFVLQNTFYYWTIPNTCATLSDFQFLKCKCFKNIIMFHFNSFSFFIIYIYFLLFICAYKAWVISPPCPHPLHPSLSPLPLQYPAETILPLSLILLKREYKQ